MEADQGSQVNAHHIHQPKGRDRVEIAGKRRELKAVFECEHVTVHGIAVR